MFVEGIVAALGLLITAFVTEFYMVLLSFGVLEGRPKFRFTVNIIYLSTRTSAHPKFLFI